MLARRGADMAKQNKNPVYDINRPVHLAWSSVYMEKAFKLFQECLAKAPMKRRLQLIDGCLHYLQEALEHATLASKATKALPQEESFLTFIRMEMICICSARVMLDNEIQLGDAKSQFWQFLHRGGKAGQAIKFARSGEQLLEDAEHLFKLAREPAEDLRQVLLDGMNGEQKARYRLAHDELRVSLARSRQIPRAERFFQIFLQGPGMKNE